MTKKQSFPSEVQLARMRKKLANVMGSRVTPKDAPPLDQIKNSICAEFVKHSLAHKLTQRQMAKLIGIDEALMSKILHYHFDEFTVDRLVKYLTVLYPQVTIKLQVA